MAVRGCGPDAVAGGFAAISPGARDSPAPCEGWDAHGTATVAPYLLDLSRSGMPACQMPAVHGTWPMRHASHYANGARLPEEFFWSPN